MLILLAEDDVKIARLLIHLFKKDGYQIDHAKDGEEAILYAQSNHYEVVVLDWMMPRKSGIDVLKSLRSSAYQGGIIMLTAKDTIDDKIEGLELGADDYLSKPFEYRELLARVKALGRRSTKKLAKDIVKVQQFELDRIHKTVSVLGEDLGLTNREFQLFSLLLENNHQVVTRELIIDRIWGLDQEVSQNNLDAFIRLLRKKIAKVVDGTVIVNVRGIGYKVEV
ncbi:MULTISPECIES: response regulator transcription factor [unclassified Fusibacter]|uniref:response regulator transcription factor n=1 Tax=unclassified Fusibacter TaxID=2624464 RepID=UPI001011FB36|nr:MULTISPECIES: response regulator transcription factor [unclassified Fusibacter]MCK8058686.1 response regulator transcription factor [Fusibacter sp. A2]NPE21760.1 response regulator transcription factor [Fusibacter sp. A1]RXV61334.1 DNA-binding response regulator [Fusibacter sp. A1]